MTVIRAGECECRRKLGERFAKGGTYWFQELRGGQSQYHVWYGTGRTEYEPMDGERFDRCFSVKEKRSACTFTETRREDLHR